MSTALSCTQRLHIISISIEAAQDTLNSQCRRHLSVYIPLTPSPTHKKVLNGEATKGLNTCVTVRK